MKFSPTPEDAATLGPLAGRFDGFESAQLVNYIRGFENMEPKRPLISPEAYDGDAARYVATAQDIYATVQAGGTERWRMIAAQPTKLQQRRLDSLALEWTDDPYHKDFRRRTKSDTRSLVRGAITKVTYYYPGTLALVSTAASLEAWASHAEACKGIMRAMLPELVSCSNLPGRAERGVRIRAHFTTAAKEAAELPNQSTLPNFWRMSLEQQRGIAQEVGTQCLELWGIFNKYGDPDTLAYIEQARMSRPVSLLTRATAGPDKAQNTAVTSAYIDETTFRIPRDRWGNDLESIHPQIGAFDTYLRDAPPLPEEEPGHQGTLPEIVQGLEIGDEVVCSDPDERLNHEKARLRLNALIDMIADGIHAPLSEHGVQRRMNWDVDRTDFVTHLCGNRPVGIYDLRATRLAASVEDVTQSGGILAEDIRLFRLDAQLKSTGKAAIENSLIVAVWGKRVPNAVQLRKKALDKAAAKEAMALHYKRSAQAMPRVRIFLKSLNDPPMK